MADRYWYGGPIPEAAQRLKARREAREQLAFSREIDARLSARSRLAPEGCVPPGARSASDLAKEILALMKRWDSVGLPTTRG